MIKLINNNLNNIWPLWNVSANSIVKLIALNSAFFLNLISFYISAVKRLIAINHIQIKVLFT